MSITSNRASDSYEKLEEKVRTKFKNLGKKIVRSIIISTLFVNSFSPCLSTDNSKNHELKEPSYKLPTFTLVDKLEDPFSKIEKSLDSYKFSFLSLTKKKPVMKDQYKNLDSNKNDFSNRSEIPVLMYHGIGNGKYCVKPDKLRSDLETLKEKDFYFVSLQTFIDEDYSKIPQGKTPVLLTFDDSLNSQLNGVIVNEKFVPNTNCAVGILEDFFKSNPDVGKGGVFFLNSHPFGTKFRKEKLTYLVNNGYDLEYHTRFHVSLRKETPEYVDRDLKKFEEEIRIYLPNYHSRAVAFPFGADPKKAVANLIKKRFLAAFDAEYHQPIRNSLYDVPRIEMSNRKGERNNLQTFVLKKESQYFKKPLMIVSKK